MKTFLRNLKHLFSHPLWLQAKFNGDISVEKHLLTGRLTVLSSRVDVLEHNLNLKVDDLEQNLSNRVDVLEHNLNLKVDDLLKGLHD